MKTTRVLTGDHCQCGACDEYFNSTKAFDRHRRGKPGVNRHCLTPTQMLAAGMCKNAGDWWITEPGAPDRFRVKRQGRDPVSTPEVEGVPTQSGHDTEAA